MGAESLTDFLYRISVAEQLTKYNDKIIKEMNEKIVENEKAKVELKSKTEQLKKDQEEMQKNLVVLSNKQQSFFEYELTLEEEIENAQKVIKMYKDAGCGMYEDINVCARSLLPPDTSFWRPLVKGYITSEYGYRTHPVTGKVNSFHDGIDMSNAKSDGDTMIYAAASGKVAMSDYNSTMGNFVIIHHKINNVTYSTSYYHLQIRQVKAGDIVTKDTIIGIMGSTGTSTSAHLHFSIASGLRYQDYYSNTDYNSRTINPRQFVNFPKNHYVNWYDRISKY